MRTALLAFAIGCGSTTPAPAPIAPPPPPPLETEAAHRERITAAHHELEDEQISAFAATCAQPELHADKRCTPSCYTAAPPDPRAGKKPAEIVHLVCAPADASAGPFAIADELGGDLRVARGRVPAAAKKGTWQADVEAEASLELKPELARGDLVRVTGPWKPIANPITAERLRCVTISHYARSLRRPLDACGGQGQIACEAMGNAAAHGVDVVHARLAEAKRLHATGDAARCRDAALEAIAVSRGLPRWRQYATLNTNKWKVYARYRTRFDGLLDEDTLFATAATLGTEAQAVHAACGGAAGPKTPPAQEQSFHTCW